MLKAPQDTDPANFSAAGLLSSLDIASRRTVVAAVSGGSDSTALLISLAAHAGLRAAGTRIVAATVDHGLRPESAREAGSVGSLCRELGVEHRILAWTGVKPGTGLLAAAREARHDLLAQLARSEHTDLVLTGHTADDQAETVTMRAARSLEQDADARGLAGIAPATLFDGDVWFARPLLAARRDALRAYLKQKRIGWIDDPTNVDARYERPAVRKSLSQADGATVKALRIAALARIRRIALGDKATRLIEAFADRPAPGLLRLRRDFLQADGGAAVHVLRILLAIAGGMPHLPDGRRVADLHGRLVAAPPMRAVLSRALIDSRAGGVFLLREARNMPSAGTGATWDGRYRIDRQAEAGASACVCGEGGVPASLAAKAAATLPPAGLPRMRPIVGPWARYLPSFDLAPARAAARLIGADEIPAPPFLGHD